MLSTKAQGSGTFLIVQIAIIIIAVIGPMFILAGLSSYMVEQASLVVGLKLTSNLVTLTHNALYAMPAGVTEVATELPRNCIPDKCLDCGLVASLSPTQPLAVPVIPLIHVVCDCDNYATGAPIRENNQVITEVSANERGLVCDGMWVKSMEPSVIFRDPDNSTAGAYGFKFKIRPHPENDFYWAVVNLPGGSYFRGSDDYETFGATYLNLHDFEGVRRAIVKPSLYMPRAFLLQSNALTLYSSSYWGHSSITKAKDDLREGLSGVLLEIFDACDKGYGDEEVQPDMCISDVPVSTAFQFCGETCDYFTSNGSPFSIRPDCGSPLVISSIKGEDITLGDTIHLCLNGGCDNCDELLIDCGSPIGVRGVGNYWWLENGSPINISDSVFVEGDEIIICRDYVCDVAEVSEDELPFCFKYVGEHIIEYEDLITIHSGGACSEYLYKPDEWRDLTDFTVILPPGRRFLRKSDTVLCEQYCPEMHSLSTGECPNNNWIDELCYDLSYVSGHECDEDSEEPCCADYEFLIGELCESGDSCTGAVNLDNFNAFYALYNGLIPEGVIEFNFSGTKSVVRDTEDTNFYLQRGGVCSDGCSEITYFPGSWSPNPIYWGPSSDCRIDFYCTEDNVIGLIVEEYDRTKKCNMKGEKALINRETGLEIEFEDADSSLFATLLRMQFPTEQTYRFTVEGGNPSATTPFGGCAGAEVTGTPIDYPSSFTGRAYQNPGAGIGLDYLINAKLSFSPDSKTYKIDLEMGGSELYQDFTFSG